MNTIVYLTDTTIRAVQTPNATVAMTLAPQYTHTLLWRCSPRDSISVYQDSEGDPSRSARDGGWLRVRNPEAQAQRLTKARERHGFQNIRTWEEWRTIRRLKVQAIRSKGKRPQCVTLWRDEDGYVSLNLYPAREENGYTPDTIDSFHKAVEEAERTLHVSLTSTTDEEPIETAHAYGLLKDAPGLADSIRALGYNVDEPDGEYEEGSQEWCSHPNCDRTDGLDDDGLCLAHAGHAI